MGRLKSERMMLRDRNSFARGSLRTRRTPRRTRSVVDNESVLPRSLTSSRARSGCGRIYEETTRLRAGVDRHRLATISGRLTSGPWQLHVQLSTRATEASRPAHATGGCTVKPALADRAELIRKVNSSL